MADDNAQAGDSTGDDTSADSQSDANNTNQTPSSEEDKSQTDNKNGGDDDGATDWSKLPDINTHPRWTEREGDWKDRYNEQEERHEKEMKQAREDLVPKPKSAEGDADIPEWSGMDAKGWKQFQEYQNKRDEAVRQATLKELGTQSEADQKAVDEATKYAHEQIAQIEVDKTLNPYGKEIDKNRLMTFVLDNHLVDSDNKWNFKMGYELMKSRGQVPTTTKDLKARKNLASNTSSDNSADPAKQTVTTPDELAKDKPW